MGFVIIHAITSEDCFLQNKDLVQIVVQEIAFKNQSSRRVASRATRSCIFVAVKLPSTFVWEQHKLRRVPGHTPGYLGVHVSV